MRNLFDVDIVECPYQPPGFVTMKDARGTVVADLSRGVVFRIPPVEFDLKMPTEFRREGDKIIGDIRLSWEFKNA